LLRTVIERDPVLADPKVRKSVEAELSAGLPETAVVRTRAPPD
jgi:hypothetical protein